jgi:hypothetical protein
MQPLRAASGSAPLLEQALVRHLTGSPASAFRHRKSRHSSDAVPGLPERIECLTQSEAHRANDARGYNADTGRSIFSVPSGIFAHFGQKKASRFPIALLKEAF